MRTIHSILFLIVASFVFSQVEITTPVQLVGPEPSRTITGMADPLSETAALTVEGAILNTAHWGVAVITADTITIQTGPLVQAYRPGLLLHFIIPADVQGALQLGCPGLARFPILRPDGLPPVAGQMRTGAVCEVIFAMDRWVLTNAPEKGCPAGTTMVNERLCIETAPTGNMYFYPSVDRCAALGGRLCKWDEHYIACVQNAGELTGLGAAWEWIDDTSNHANTSEQVGFGTCEANRWADPQNITFGRTRCCFTPR